MNARPRFRLMPVPRRARAESLTRRVVLGMFVSLDGFVSSGTGNEGWIFRSGDDATDAWVVAQLDQTGLIAMGSRSFGDMA